MRQGFSCETGFEHKERLEVLIVFDDGLAPIYPNALPTWKIGSEGTVCITDLVEWGDI